MECRQHQRLFSEQRLDYRCRHCAHGHFGKSRYLRDYENEVEGRLLRPRIIYGCHDDSGSLHLDSAVQHFQQGWPDRSSGFFDIVVRGFQYADYHYDSARVLLHAPKEVEEAAVMDGRSVHRVFFRIVLPMTGSVLATTAIINMIYNWNEFIFVNTFISSDMFKTLTVGVQNFIGQYTTDWGAIGATLMISILPILLMFLFLSDRIVEGIVAGSVKG